MSTYTKQPGTKFSILDQYYSTVNTHTGDYLEVYAGAGYGYTTRRSLLHFDISDFSGDAASVNTGKLYLYYCNTTNDPTGYTLDIFRVLRSDWNEYDSCWEYYTTCMIPWSVTGCDNDGTDYTSTNAASIAMPGSYGWLEIDITNMIKDAITSASKQLHLIIRFHYTEEEYGQQAQFYSNLYTGDTSLTPKVIVDYASGTANNAIFFGTNF